MSLRDLIVLAIVQGFTEFLPISSKTHLLFALHGLGYKQDIPLIVMLHAGSLLAILVYYTRAWVGLLRERRREMIPLVLGSIPAVAAYLLLKKHLEPLYENLPLAAALLIPMGIYLYVADRFGVERQGLEQTSRWRIFMIGMAQACALLPGVSRSGSTIGAGYLCGLKRADAVRFSFFLGAVAIAGALAMKGPEAMRGAAGAAPLPIVIGVIVSFGVSLAAIKIVETLSLRGRFTIFAAYCVTAGVAGLIYFATRG